MPPFISCAACGCAAKSFETTCPHCGEALRTQIGVPRTAAALLLGLVTVTGSAAMGCGDSTSDSGGANAGGADEGGAGEGGFAAEYGVPATGGGGAAAEGGAGEGGFAAEYGVPGTGGAGGAP